MPLPVRFKSPPVLANALKNSTKFSPSFERPEHADNLELWQLYLDLMELDRPKLQALVDKLHADEDSTKYEARQSLAAVFNLVPLVIDVVRLYLFSDEPSIDVGGDTELQAFVRDCDGAGTPLAGFIRQSALPLALGMGWIDAVVENPLSDNVDQATGADPKPSPTVIAFTPIQRNNWSCRSNHAYNWATFTDQTNENPDPLDEWRTPGDVFLTYAAAGTIVGSEEKRSVWIRSERAAAPTREGGADNGVETGRKPAFEHFADYCPTARVPIATLYYKRSIDPRKRHFGLSKIAIMAVLTKLIINVLSWATDDIKANLALLAIATKGGKAPTKDDGTDAPAVDVLTSFSILYYDAVAGKPPTWVQGDVAHIEIKFKLCFILVSEILRLAHLGDVAGGATNESAGGASSSPGGGTKSGFHAIVNRNELFRELADLSKQLDVFTLDVLALAKSWITDSDWDREKLTTEGKVSVQFYKGPWTMDPMTPIIAQAKEILAMFRSISPAFCTNQLQQVVRAALAQDDPDLKKILDEITKNGADALREESADGLVDQAKRTIENRGITVGENGDAKTAQTAAGNPAD